MSPKMIMWAVCMLIWGMMFAVDKPFIAIIFSTMALVVVVLGWNE